jgi:DNA repair exonuclease SbcCD nuclease subunit
MRLLHITDLHLRHHLAGTADKPERLSRMAAGLLGRLSRQIPEIDPAVVVITGDLLDVPKPLL